MLSKTARGVPRFSMIKERRSSSTRRSSFPKLVRARRAVTIMVLSRCDLAIVSDQFDYMNCSVRWQCQGAAALVTEMAHAREYHGHAELVGGSNHVRVAHRTARLNYGRGACLSAFLHAVRKWKERIGRDHAIFERQA